MAKKRPASLEGLKESQKKNTETESRGPARRPSRSF